MKVVNRTVWKTAQLKAILQRAAVAEFDDGARRKRLRVEVRYTRGGHCASGYAWVKSNYAIVRIACPTATKGGKRVTLDLTEVKLGFASVACHEFAHCRGMQHRQMPSYYKWEGDWRRYVAWATDFPLEVQEAKRDTRSKAEKVDAKLAHVLAMKRKAETRLKRAQTIVRKWKTKEAYYRRQAAAAGPGGGTKITRRKG